MCIASNRLSAFIAALLITVASVAAPSAIAETPVSAASAVSASAPGSASATDVNATPVPPPAAAVTETVDNPYGLDALWKGGDFVARGTLIILVLMSMGSWYIIITKLIEQVKLMGQAKDAKNNFWKAPTVGVAIAGLKPASAYHFIAQTGSTSTEHHDGALLEQIDLNTWITMSIQRSVEKVQSRLQDGLAFLATVGSTAPFVGLFGTVWGIYHALTAIGVAGQASIDKVAGPVGEALIMTAIGLAVAVPAVLGYNWLVRRNKSAMEEIRSFSADLHAVLLSGVMSTSSAGQIASIKKKVS
ncbi:MotA/TolQ/ExbB proton channel family protein [Glaciimonas immobilis]|uniref:Biopolymer transport protein ExbB n=1 Tax=Glaciimonas immobilis TaxID=728004 RepID=A0A840RXE6_9BURK|nr:MotA/TolQ/ExbB proton channel family protein [Glaciimonas immobilis]KAF3996446.1 MotA/TolQ/ExbB proton channel family protein [Glaciimonas immobilis]MBB5201211.1 biopolymer transport protein ExbB [Glaciimonas immobilis]